MLTVGSNIVAIINNILTPRMLNPGAWDWANYAGFFWVSLPSPLRSAPMSSILSFLPHTTPTPRLKKNQTNKTQGGICFLCVIYTYFRVPEPRGRSFAELDMLFEQKVSARKFDSTVVDAFEEAVEGGVMSEYKDTLKERKVHA